MNIHENVHLIRKEFFVTPTVKRYINIYLITGRDCYLIDSGVAGSEELVGEYLRSIGRNMTDIKGIFLTHAHPDHAGGAASIKRLTGCNIYAPAKEINWIEDIDAQFQERPIPNFYQLLAESAPVDCPVLDGDVIDLEAGLQIRAIETAGHSHGSMSYLLNGKTVFTGDAIPQANDLPIFVDYEASMRSLDRISALSEAFCFCPAWSDVFGSEELEKIIAGSRNLLRQLRDAAIQVEKEFAGMGENEKITEIMKRANVLQYAGNPLVVKSIEACRQVDLNAE